MTNEEYLQGRLQIVETAMFSMLQVLVELTNTPTFNRAIPSALDRIGETAAASVQALTKKAETEAAAPVILTL